MPALFIGHGSPMNAIEDNPFSRHLKKLGEKIPKPRVVLVVSAHWQSRGSKLLHIANPKTIYDFYGFPEELYRVVYPAPGAPIEAEALSNRLGQKVIQLDEQWGFDHGVWAVLCHLYPKADIPVLQLSLNKDFGFREHFEFAKSLKYLRDEGVLILGSGNVVHNLGALDFSFRSGPVQ